jgi:hypothetical protein
VLTTNALADYFVDQPDKLNSNIKKRLSHSASIFPLGSVRCLLQKSFGFITKG